MWPQDFKKWGMTSSMVSAMILSDLILEKDNPYLPVFTPHRMHIGLSRQTSSQRYRPFDTGLTASYGTSESNGRTASPKGTAAL